MILLAPIILGITSALPSMLVKLFSAFYRLHLVSVVGIPSSKGIQDVQAFLGAETETLKV